MVRKARIGTYLWSKGQPSGSFRKAVRSSPATTKLIFLPLFLSVGSFFFWPFFCSCQSLSFLSFGDHHFPSSSFGHKLPPCTKLETYLPHIPTDTTLYVVSRTQQKNGEKGTISGYCMGLFLSSWAILLQK